MDDLGCAVNHVLSCHCFRFLLLFFRSLLGYVKDSNNAEHSVDLKSVLVCINFMHHDELMARCDKGYRSTDYRLPII